MSTISKNELISDNCFKCISSPNGNGSVRADGIWMIFDCPKTFPKTPAQGKCVAESSLSDQDHKDNISVVTRDGKTYKNRFCSRCHGVSDDELSYYALSYSCSILPPRSYNEEITLAFLSSFCSILWKPNSGDHRRYCYSNTIKTCSREASEILQNSCHNGSPGLVTSREKKGLGYKNVYCALCHSDILLECGLAKTFPYPGPPLPFSVIMDLGFSSQSHSANITRKTHVSCPTGKVYDHHLDLCRTGIESVPSQARFDKYGFDQRG